ALTEAQVDARAHGARRPHHAARHQFDAGQVADALVDVGGTPEVVDPGSRLDVLRVDHRLRVGGGGEHDVGGGHGGEVGRGDDLGGRVLPAQRRSAPVEPFLVTP